MANEALSKDKIRLQLPRDISNLQREGKVDPELELEAGTLVCRRDNRLVPCDLSDVTDGDYFEYAPVEIVWTDGVHRVDLTRIELDGTEVKELTTIAFDCMALIDDSLIDLDDSPGEEGIKEGMYLLRGNDGKMRVATLPELHALSADHDGAHLIVGQIISDGEGEGKYFAQLNLT